MTSPSRHMPRCGRDSGRGTFGLGDDTDDRAALGQNRQTRCRIGSAARRVIGGSTLCARVRPVKGLTARANGCRVGSGCRTRRRTAGEWSGSRRGGVPRRRIRADAAQRGGVMADVVLAHDYLVQVGGAERVVAEWAAGFGARTRRHARVPARVDVRGVPRARRAGDDPGSARDAGRADAAGAAVDRGAHDGGGRRRRTRRRAADGRTASASRSRTSCTCTAPRAGCTRPTTTACGSAAVRRAGLSDEHAAAAPRRPRGDGPRPAHSWRTPP